MTHKTLEAPLSLIKQEYNREFWGKITNPNNKIVRLFLNFWTLFTFQKCQYLSLTTFLISVQHFSVFLDPCWQYLLPKDINFYLCDLTLWHSMPKTNKNLRIFVKKVIKMVEMGNYSEFRCIGERNALKVVIYINLIISEYVVLYKDLSCTVKCPAACTSTTTNLHGKIFVDKFWNFVIFNYIFLSPILLKLFNFMIFYDF